MKMTTQQRKTKAGKLKLRHMRIRRKVAGTAERPRVMIRKTLRHLHAIVVDDSVRNGSHTLFSLDTVERDGKGSKSRANCESAKALGLRVSSALKEKGIAAVVFDRGGYPYHGVVKALCEAIREGGIQV
jgi:large subunit ribosomal protein L18